MSGSVAAVKRLLQIARSGTARAAQRSSQWRPAIASCSQKTEATPAARTAGPKIA
jgi:hypothetical protein